MLLRMLVSCFCMCGFTISNSSSKQFWSIRRKFLNAAVSSARSSWTRVLYTPRERFLEIYGFVQISLFRQRFLFFLRRLTQNNSKTQAATLRCECHWTMSAMLQIGVCFELTRVWRVKAWVCQLFKVCQHEFANFSLSCEGRLSIKRVAEFW